MKKSLLILFLLVVACTWISKAQFAAPDIQWQKVLGGPSTDQAYSIKEISDGGYIVAGESNSLDIFNSDVWGNHSDYDFWVVRLDGNGDTVWTRSLGGSSIDVAESVQQTIDGGFIIAGYTFSTNGQITGSHNNFDCWLVKLDGSGNLGGNGTWAETLGGTGADYAYAVQQTFDGGYIVLGLTNSVNNPGSQVTGIHGGSDIWVAKLGESGNLQMERCLGGTGDETGYAIQQTSDSGFIIAGTTTSNNDDVSGNHGLNDAWVVKIGGMNDSLKIQWQKCLGGSLYDYAQSVQQTIDGGYIVAGYSNSTDSDLAGDGNHGEDDCWIIKLDNGGNVQWQKLYGGSGDDEAYSVQQTADSGYVFLGRSNSLDGSIFGNHGGYDFWMMKLNQSGDSSWQKALGGSNDDYGYSMQQTTDKGFILAGVTNSNDGDLYGQGYHGDGDFWIVKLGQEVGIAEKHNYITAFQVSPNPVAQSTHVSFALNQPEDVTIKIYDVTGREVKNLMHSNLSEGLYQVRWNADNDAGNNVGNGLYLLTIETPDGSQTKGVAVAK